MELYEREFLISRIRVGYIPIELDGKKYKVYHPSPNILFRANEIYNIEYNRAIEENLFDDSDIYSLLLEYELWTEQDEKHLTEILPEHVEKLKIELYNNVLRSNIRDKIRKYLKTAKNEISRLYQIRHSFDHITRTGYANYVKNMFLVMNCARYKDKRVNWQNIDINKIMNLYHAGLLDLDTIRELARTQPWNGLWPILKANGRIFDNTFLSTEQQSLISWSIMYDKIYESPDCPSDEIIEDDDMLDGWLLIQRRQREGNRKKNELEGGLNKKISEADDIFLVVDTIEDAKKINLLNDNRAIQIKRQRFKEIKEKGVVLEQQLPDIKQRYAMQMQQAYNKRVKGQ